MIHTGTLLVGQGLSGSWLSWWLSQYKEDFLVIDEGKEISSSRIASGVINPVTGRVLAKTWMAETLLPFALEAYTNMGNALGIRCIQSTRVLHSFPTMQMKEAFDKRLPELSDYLSVPEDLEYWKSLMEIPYGLGSISPALLIDLNLLLNTWKKVLERNQQFIGETFDAGLLELTETHIRYRDIQAERIVFCDGIHGMDLPFFSRLPFSANKGEALLIEIEDLPADHIYKKGISLVPYPHLGGAENQRYFWAGSTYENRYQTEGPTESFRERTEAAVRNWIRRPFQTLHHWAAIRPATVERRPFAGFHPHFPRVGILNGMGTKGCSLAPYFGQELAKQIKDGSTIRPEASIRRFSSLLRP
jgi:glycine/D-amino acid oxidase-like deaminating enzyme